MKVICNNCMAVFDEEKIVWDGDTCMEYCPECGEGGCLMDIVDRQTNGNDGGAA